MSSFNVLSANVRKVGIELMRYLPNTISMIVTFYAIFLLFFLGIRVVGGGAMSGESSEYLIVSMMLWFLALMAMQGIGWEITNEATRGTLEQLYMSPCGHLAYFAFEDARDSVSQPRYHGRCVGVEHAHGAAVANIRPYYPDTAFYFDDYLYGWGRLYGGGLSACL